MTNWANWSPTTRPGRAGDHEITLYKSVGLAVQDIATARLVVAAARQKGLGTDIVLSR